MDQLKTIIAIISPMITVITLVFNIILKKTYNVNTGIMKKY